MTPTNILKVDHKFPATAYIVGSGESANRNAGHIPPGSFVIACNQAIELPIKASIWLAHDPAILSNEWFNTRIAAIAAEKRNLGIRSISAGCDPVPVFEADKIARFFPPVKVVFNAGGDLYKPLEKEDGVMSTRATVAGIALQLCYFCGCVDIITCGIDMGGRYYDGKFMPGFEGDWPCKPEWEWLVSWIRSRGISVRRIEEVFDADGIGIESDEPEIVDALEPADPGPPISPENETTFDLRVTLPKGGTPVVSLIKPSTGQVTGHEVDTTGLPAIGYLCMSYDPIDKINAIFDFEQQDWPVDRKTLYLLHQHDGYGQFPGPTFCNRDLQIVDVNCEGYTWPEMWLFKLMEYLKVSEAAYTLWWDEDDRYPSNYTKLAMQPILDDGARLAWNWDMAIARYSVRDGRYEYRSGWYNTPIATLAIETALLRDFADRLWVTIYDGDYMHSPKRRSGVPYGGAQDDRLRRMIYDAMRPIPHHRGEKLYTIHGHANSAQLRAQGQSLDYTGRRGVEEEKAVKPSRFLRRRD